MPTVTKILGPEYILKQSSSEVMSRTVLRGLLVNPSGGGKTNLMANLILNNDMYRGVFDRIFIFSPTVHLDSTGAPVKTDMHGVRHDVRFDRAHGPGQIGHDFRLTGPRAWFDLAQGPL